MVNTFVWYDIMTTDRAAAASFYADVIGLRAEEASGPIPYTLLYAGNRQVAGIMDVPERARGMPPQWLGYIGVDDVDAKARDLTDAGAALQREPQDIPGIGRFAILRDPQGAKFMLFASDRKAAEQPAYMAPGTVGWHELHTTDWERAWTFYAGQFGWEQGDRMEMGPMGTYQMYRIGREIDEGAMVNDRQRPQPAWLFYFAVNGVVEARERLIAGGGTPVMGPMEVPGGAWVTLAKDPQGAMFALCGPERKA